MACWCPQEVIACVRETLMTEYLFFRGAWAHFKPSEVLSGAIRLDLDDLDWFSERVVP